MKAMPPYQNSSMFHQEIEEVINFKLAHEYIFVTVSLSCLKIFGYIIFIEKCY